MEDLALVAGEMLVALVWSAPPTGSGVAPVRQQTQSGPSFPMASRSGALLIDDPSLPLDTTRNVVYSKRLVRLVAIAGAMADGRVEASKRRLDSLSVSSGPLRVSVSVLDPAPDSLLQARGGSAEARSTRARLCVTVTPHVESVHPLTWTGMDAFEGFTDALMEPDSGRCGKSAFGLGYPVPPIG